VYINIAQVFDVSMQVR